MAIFETNKSKIAIKTRIQIGLPTTGTGTNYWPFEKAKRRTEHAEFLCGRESLNRLVMWDTCRNWTLMKERNSLSSPGFLTNMEIWPAVRKSCGKSAQTQKN
jgi:hypothetical protein